MIKKAHCFLYLILCFLMFTVIGCSGIQKQSDNVRFEHLALNVENPKMVADWYCKYLGMKIQRVCGPPLNTRFVSDRDGNMMFEFYQNTQAKLPNYFETSPGTMHIAFFVNDIESLFGQLKHSGATVEQEPNQASSGDVFCMVRDPWGIPLQFVKRKEAMLSN